MEHEAVFFIDSGVGGLPYCAAFSRRNPQVPVIYIADNRHFPYGAKSKAGIEAVLRELTAALISRFGARLIVLACNTASVSALAALRERFPGAAFVGTVPAVRPALLHAGIAGVLGTERTIADPYIRRLCGQVEEERGRPCRLIYRAAPELVQFAEHEFWTADEERKLSLAREYTAYFRAEGARALVLGCTHFLLLAAHFKRHTGDDMPLFDSIDGVCAQIERVYARLPPPSAPALRAQDWAGSILLTGGAADDKWRAAAAMFSLKTGMFEGSAD